tara:strand:+ start:6905 stop:7867 length:963 start_codon:yes stop_codon:yes gene_type:complete
MIKVAVLDDYQNIFKEFIDIDKYKAKYDFTIFTQPFANEEQASIELEKFQVLFIMRERTPITKSLMNNMKYLKYIMTSGMRNNSIDMEEAKKRNIIVCGTDINSNPAAEITWALILGLMRNMKQEIDNMFQGYWQNTIGFELKGKNLGLIGLGKIGSQVAKIGKAFGMQVFAWSENLNLSNANKLGVLPMSKDELLKQSDIVSLHIVLANKYKNLISQRELKLMKKTSFLINTSRGPIINEKDLIKALEDDVIAGAGLDVYEIEPLPQDHKLRFLPNALLMPHLGYVTEENYHIFYNQMLENLDSCINDKPKRHLNQAKL